MHLILHDVHCVHHLRLWLQTPQMHQFTSKTPQKKSVHQSSEGIESVQRFHSSSEGQI